MKKIVFLLVCLFLITGCDITYNVNIDEDLFSEDISVLEKNYDNFYYYSGNMSMVELSDFYLQKEIPYHYDDLYVPEANKKIKGVSYYDVKNLSNDYQVGLSLKSKFKDLEDYSRSNMVWKGCLNKRFSEKDGNYIIEVSGFKSFDEYDNLDNLIINITSDYKLVKSNADEVHGKVYTWNINRDNYDTKKIKIIFEVDNPILKNDVFSFVIVAVIALIIGLLLYNKYRNRFDSENSL